MHLRVTTDLLTGLFFFGLGAFAIIYGWSYPMGTSARIGPGYYPTIIACGLIMFGAVLIGRSFLFPDPGDVLGDIALRPLVLVLIGTLAFGLLIERAGFVLASFVLVFTVRFAERDFRLVEVALLATGLTVFIALMFWLGLSLPLRPFPRFS